MAGKASFRDEELRRIPEGSETLRQSEMQSEMQSERQSESQRGCIHAAPCEGRRVNASTPAVLHSACCTHNSYILLFIRS
jgi:hypothetical protein